MIIDPVIPIPWIACIAAVLLGAAIHYQLRSASHLGKSRATFLLATRIIALAAITAILLQPSREESVPVPPREKSILFMLDASASMNEPHSDGATRIDAARADLERAGVLHDGGGAHRFFTFAEAAVPATHESIRHAPADGATTLIDSSVAALLRMAAQPPPAAMFLLSDGHDFDLVPPADTARRARAHDMPIFTLPYGTLESARDVSVRIAGYHPHTFVRQRTRLEAFVRSFGCPHESLTIDLLLDGQPVQRKSLDTGTESFHTIHFDVTHEEPGQYEYTFRVAPVPNERELSNNTATTIPMKTNLLALASAAILSSAPTIAANPTPPVDWASETIHCGNFIYGNNQTSVCFAETFLSDAAAATGLDINPRFARIPLGSDAIYNTPMFIFTGEGDFVLKESERAKSMSTPSLTPSCIDHSCVIIVTFANPA